jgi:hypothetical protein
MRLLIKYPSRSRPKLFAQTLDAWITRLADPTRADVLVSLDEDDAELSAYRRVCSDRGIRPVIGRSRNKIEAINRDLETAGDWDVVVVIADDMVPLVQGWDEMIRLDLPTPDAALWYPDGRQQRLCTLPILGRAVVQRMRGRIYHPAFESVYADNFQQHALQAWGRLKMVKRHVAEHRWKAENDDALMQRNEDPTLYAQDKATFERLVREFAVSGGRWPA